MPKLSKEKTDKLLKLVRARIKANAIGHFGPFDGLEFVDYFDKANKLDDRIVKLLYGTPNLKQIGLNRGWFKPTDRQRSVEKMKRQKHKLPKSITKLL
jgi:uncharacterized protein YdcH (DUF465 family)